MKIKHLIFDVGCVLVNYDWKTYLHSCGFDPAKEQAIARAVFAGPYWKEFDRGAWSRRQLLDAFSSLAPEYREDIGRVLDHAEGCISRLSYARPWLQELRNRGFHTWYLSNYSSVMLEKTRDALDFLDLMDGGLFSCEVSLVKPDPAIFRALLARYPEISPSEAVFLDDAPANVRAARELGFSGIVFQNRSQAELELRNLLRA